MKLPNEGNPATWEQDSQRDVDEPKLDIISERLSKYIGRREFVEAVLMGGLFAVGEKLGEKLGFEQGRQVLKEATSGILTTSGFIDFPGLSSDPALAPGRFWWNSALRQLGYSPDGLLSRYLSPEQATLYVVFIDAGDGKIKARNGTTGKIDYSDTDAATVIESTISAANERGIIQLSLGDFEHPVSISKPIELRGRVIITGRGPYATWLKLADSVNDSMFKFMDTEGRFYYLTMMNLGLDGNKEENTVGSLIDIGLSNLYDGLIFNCHFQNASEYCIRLKQPWNWRISHSTIETGGTAGLYASGANEGSGDDLKVIETKFLFNTVGADVRCNNVRFLGCFFYQNRQNALYARHSDSLTLIGSQFKENSYQHAGVYGDIELEDVDRFKAVGIAINGMSTSKCGIWFRENVNGSRVVASSIIRTTTAAIINEGTDNQVDGVVLPAGQFSNLAVRNGGTSTQNGDGDQTTFEIAHGLPRTPTYWSVVKGSDIKQDIDYVTADATDLKVSFKAAPLVGTGNVVLVWKAEL
jgi:hypothetical protein